MQTIHPVILSGGMGSRLWPLSRARQPKQFQPIRGAGSQSFLQATVDRHRTEAFEAPLIVTSEAQIDLVERQLDEMGSDRRIIGEPVGRNTGPAVLAAALELAEDDPSALMLVLPSDHVIDGDINGALCRMRPGCIDGRIVLFGITPRYPETGFGYITNGAEIDGHPGLHEVAAFVEKPCLEDAAALVDSGSASWASGISLFRADVIIEEFERLDPDTLDAVRRARKASKAISNGRLLDADAFAEARNDPTERIVFEHTGRAAVAALDVEWNDVGAWSAVHSIGEKSAEGNVTSGRTLTMGTTNSLIRGEDKLVAVLGMSDVIVVETRDALLVTDHKHAQMVKEAVSLLKSRGMKEVETHPPRTVAGANGSAGPATDGHIRMLSLKPGESMGVEARGPAGSLVTVSAGDGSLELGSSGGTMSVGDSFRVACGRTLTLSNTCDGRMELVVLDLEERCDGPEDKRIRSSA